MNVCDDYRMLLERMNYSVMWERRTCKAQKISISWN